MITLHFLLILHADKLHLATLRPGIFSLIISFRVCMASETSYHSDISYNFPRQKLFSESRIESSDLLLYEILIQCFFNGIVIWFNWRCKQIYFSGSSSSLTVDPWLAWFSLQWKTETFLYRWLILLIISIVQVLQSTTYFKRAMFVWTAL